jgi:hypothetical protein
MAAGFFCFFSLLALIETDDITELKKKNDSPSCFSACWRGLVDGQIRVGRSFAQ